MQGRTAKKNVAQTNSAITVANSVWEKSSTFNREIIGNAFYFFVPGSSFAYPLKVCFNNNYNDCEPFSFRIHEIVDLDFCMWVDAFV